MFSSSQEHADRAYRQHRDYTRLIASLWDVTDGCITLGGQDIAKLTPTSDYPTGYDETADQAKQEADSDARPDYQPLDFDPTDYDTIFIGYPIWWYELPMVVEKFFDDYDLSGKTIVPFNTHEGSGDGGTYSTIKEREPDATVLDGLAIRGGNAGEDSTKQEIQEWFAGLNLE